MNKLNEAFASPFGLKKELVLDGEPLYSSKKLKQQLIDILSSELGTSSDDISKLINKGKLIPVYSSGGSVFKIGLTRLFGADSSGMVDKSKGNAFYVPKLKSIFIVIDNNISKLGFVNDKWIAMICVHEMIHLCTRVDPFHTWNMFKDDLYKYYINFYSLFLDIDKTDREFIKLVKDFTYSLYKTEVRNPDSLKLREIILTQGHFLVKLLKFSKLSKDKSDEMVKDMIDFIHHLSPKYSLSFYDNYKTGKILREAYKEVSGHIPHFSYCYQELYIPSEVIAIMSSFHKAKPIQLIKLLADKL